MYPTKDVPKQSPLFAFCAIDPRWHWGRHHACTQSPQSSMHPKSVLFMGTICPWAAILRTNGRSSHRSRVYRETRSAVPLHDANPRHVSADIHAFARARAREKITSLASMTYTHIASRPVKYERRAPHHRSRRGR